MDICNLVRQALSTLHRRQALSSIIPVVQTTTTACVVIADAANMNVSKH